MNWISRMIGLKDNYVISLVEKDNYLFAGTQSDGVYRSSDKGNTWNQINNGLNHFTINALTIKGDYVFAGSGNYGGGVYRSSDNGETWSQQITGFDFPLYQEYIKTFIVQGDIIYAGVRGTAIYISSNNGNSWERHEFIQGPHSIGSIVKYREFFITAGAVPIEIGLSRDNFKSMVNFNEGIITDNPDGTI